MVSPSSREGQRLECMARVYRRSMKEDNTISRSRRARSLRTGIERGMAGSPWSRENRPLSALDAPRLGSVAYLAGWKAIRRLKGG
jgi:hypothetical protein